MIELSKSDDLWVITLNRPDKANSLNSAMLRELIAIVGDAGSARGLILTGKGRVFSAGADLDEVAKGLATSPLWESLSARLAALPALKIAALNGTLAGGAFGVALACDLRIAVPGAEFFYPAVRRNVLPQASDPARLAALVGPSRAKLLLMAGERVGAETALGWGLVDRIAPPELLLEEAHALTKDMCNARPEIAGGIASLCRFDQGQGGKL